MNSKTDDDSRQLEEDAALARRVLENWRAKQAEARAKADAAAAAHLREHRRLSDNAGRRK
jgi:hypothetical protein